MIKSICIIALLLLSDISLAQIKSWSFAEAEVASRSEPKPFVLYLHTSWCKFCNLIENTTLKDQETIDLLNAEYYFISFDAEQKTPVVFNNKTFRYISAGKDAGMHQLTVSLGADPVRPAFPSIIILDAGYSIMYRQEQYVTAASLRQVLRAILSKD